MTCSMSFGGTQVRFGKLAFWLRHWRKRDVTVFRLDCRCDADEVEHLGRVIKADCRETQVLAGKWPVDRISWRIERLGSIDTT